MHFCLTHFITKSYYLSAYVLAGERIIGSVEHYYYATIVFAAE